MQKQHIENNSDIRAAQSKGGTLSEDWYGDPAIYFRVILSDQASRTERLAEVTGKVGEKLFDQLGLAAFDRIPHFRFRSESEQISLKDNEWD